MYKSKLQEFCHRKSWQLPEYSVVKQGQDHNPRFDAVVIVNGQEFSSESACKSSRQAQNEAAKIAMDFFSASPAPPNLQPQLRQPSGTPVSTVSSSLQPETPTCISHFRRPSLDISSFPQPSLSGIVDARPDLDNKLSSQEKSQLELEKTNVSSEIEDFSEVQPNLQATDDALAVNDVDKDCTESTDVKHLYKNQLQSFAQKRSLTLPVYTCERDGPPHASRFRCKVEIDGKSYESRDFFATLKDAEHAAAKVALMSLCQDAAQEDNLGLYKNLLQEMAQKRGLGLPAYNTSRSGEVHRPIFVSTVKMGGEIFEGQPSRTKKQAEMIVAKVAYSALKNRPESISTRKRGAVSCDLEFECARDTHTSSHNVAQPQLADNCGFVSSFISKLESGRSSSKRIIVCPRQPDMKLPANSTILPMSDDKWVAFSLPNVASESSMQ